MGTRSANTAGRAFLVCVFVVVTGLFCAGLITAAALVPAPVEALPFISVICVICPVTVAYELPASIATLRAEGRRRRSARELTRLRRALDRLPETEHPLGL